jgi:hypothetical protein
MCGIILAADTAATGHEVAVRPQYYAARILIIRPQGRIIRDAATAESAAA